MRCDHLHVPMRAPFVVLVVMPHSTVCMLCLLCLLCMCAVYVCCVCVLCLCAVSVCCVCGLCLCDVLVLASCSTALHLNGTPSAATFFGVFLATGLSGKPRQGRRLPQEQAGSGLRLPRQHRRAALRNICRPHRAESPGVARAAERPRMYAGWAVEHRHRRPGVMGHDEGAFGDRNRIQLWVLTMLA